jgi:hypothetical protein
MWLSVLAFVLYAVFAFLPTLFLGFRLTTGFRDGLGANGRLLAFTVVADVVFTVGAVFAARSLRMKDQRRSWRHLGWTALAFATAFGVLVFNAATTTRS